MLLPCWGVRCSRCVVELWRRVLAYGGAEVWLLGVTIRRLVAEVWRATCRTQMRGSVLGLKGRRVSTADPGLLLGSAGELNMPILWAFLQIFHLEGFFARFNFFEQWNWVVRGNQDHRFAHPAGTQCAVDRAVAQGVGDYAGVQGGGVFGA